LPIYNRNAAYDISKSNYMPDKKSKKNILNLPKNKKKTRLKSIILAKAFCTAAVLAGVFSTIIYNQVQLLELTEKIVKNNKILNENISINTQLKMKIESSMPLRYIEEYAQENLNMKKINNNQIEYITVTENN